jgi:hypothetical protein
MLMLTADAHALRTIMRPQAPVPSPQPFQGSPAVSVTVKTAPGAGYNYDRLIRDGSPLSPAALAAWTKGAPAAASLAGNSGWVQIPLSDAADGATLVSSLNITELISVARIPCGSEVGACMVPACA